MSKSNKIKKNVQNIESIIDNLYYIKEVINKIPQK